MALVAVGLGPPLFESILLQWMLAPHYNDDGQVLRFCLVFSGSTPHLPCPVSLDAQSVVIVISSIVTHSHDTCLAKPLGGAATSLPRLLDHLWLDEATCTVSANGSTS